MPRSPRVLFLVVCAVCAGAQAPEVPVVDAGAGVCWVDFFVTQKGKPVYNAKIHSQVRYGKVHKTDIEVGTNYEGKARVAGLPQNVRRPPLDFDVRKDSAETTVSHDPAANCHASLDVTLPSS